MLASTGNPAFCRLIGEECLPVFLRWTMPYDYSEQAQQSRPLRLEEGPTTEACEGFMRWPLQTQLFRQRELCLTHILRYCNGASLTSLRQAECRLGRGTRGPASGEVAFTIHRLSQFCSGTSFLVAVVAGPLEAAGRRNMVSRTQTVRSCAGSKSKKQAQGLCNSFKTTGIVLSKKSRSYDQTASRA